MYFFPILKRKYVYVCLLGDRRQGLTLRLVISECEYTEREKKDCNKLLFGR